MGETKGASTVGAIDNIVPCTCPVCKDSEDAAKVASPAGASDNKRAQRLSSLQRFRWCSCCNSYDAGMDLATLPGCHIWGCLLGHTQALVIVTRKDKDATVIFSASGKSKLFRRWVVVLVLFMLLWIKILNKSNSERETVHLTYNFRIQPVTEGRQGRNLKASLLAVPYSITSHGGPLFTAKDMAGTVEDAACW